MAGVLGHFLTSVGDVAFLTSVRGVSKRDILIAAAPQGPAGGYSLSLTHGNRPPLVWVAGCSLVYNIITQGRDMTKKVIFVFRQPVGGGPVAAAGRPAGFLRRRNPTAGKRGGGVPARTQTRERTRTEQQRGSCSFIYSYFRFVL